MIATGYFENVFRTGYALGIRWTQNSYSIEDNTSNVTVTAYLVSKGSSYYINSSASKTVRLRINGTIYSYTARGLADLNGGFVYNLRNTNNPASARAYINLDASGMAIWDLRIKNYPLTLRYQVNLPLMGVMFSPHYGQSYYEIFSLGNSSGVVKFTSLHNQPSLRQMLTADFPIGRAKIRFAYIWDAQQSKVNDIKTHTYSHVFMVGFVKELYLLKNKKKR